MRDSGEHDDTVSEPTSYSERNIDHEVELHRLQELLRTGGMSEQVEETNKQILATDSHDSSVTFSSSSTTSTETKDVVHIDDSSKTTDSPSRRECRGSAILKERRAYFLQNGCNRLTTENDEQKRHSVDVSQLTNGATFHETACNTAATVTTSEPFNTPVLPSTSNVMITVPGSRAVKMQHTAEQHMQQLADDLQRTFDATTTLSPPNIGPVSSELCLQHQEKSAAVPLPELSVRDTAAKSAADAQSVTSDYSTMSSVCGGQDDGRRNRLVSADLEIITAPGFDTRKITDRSAVGRRRNRNEVPHSTPRSQSSGNFSLTNHDTVEASLYTASAIELSQDSIDSAADRSEQLSLSLSSQMSGSQVSDSDDLMRTVGVANKLSFNPSVQPLVTVGQKSCNIDSSCVQSADTHVEQFEETEPAVGLTLQSDAHTNSSVGLTVQHDMNVTKPDSETDKVLEKPSCTVNPVSSEKQDVCKVKTDKNTAEIDTELVAPSEQNTDCRGGTDVSKLLPSTDGDDKGISVCSSKEEFVQSPHPVHRLVRRHTLGGTEDLAIHMVDRNLESPLSVQSAPSQNEERLSAWQRLKPAVKDQLPNFGMWLATQRQLHHVRSSPALFVGVGVKLTPAACLHSSQLNWPSVV